jgi:DNA-binding NarL/FixJ family response regulator
MRPRIVIADDHELSRRGIRTILNSDSRWEVCGEAIDGRDAVEKVGMLKPDVIIVDALMPDTSGIEAVRQIRRIAPSIKIIMVSAHDSAAVSQLANLIGADGFLTKEQCGTRLNETIAKALRSHPER